MWETIPTVQSPVGAVARACFLRADLDTTDLHTTRFLEFLSSSSVWPHVGWLARLAQPLSRESTTSSSHHERILSLHRFHATPLLHASVELVSYLCNTRLSTDHAWSLNIVLHTTVLRVIPSPLSLNVSRLKMCTLYVLQSTAFGLFFARAKSADTTANPHSIARQGNSACRSSFHNSVVCAVSSCRTRW